MQETRPSGSLRRLSVKQRQCRFFDEPMSVEIPAYSTSICHILCRYHYAMKVCGCKPFFYHILGKYIQLFLRWPIILDSLWVANQKPGLFRNQPIENVASGDPLMFYGQRPITMNCLLVDSQSGFVILKSNDAVQSERCDIMYCVFRW